MPSRTEKSYARCHRIGLHNTVAAVWFLLLVQLVAPVFTQAAIDAGDGSAPQIQSTFTQLEAVDTINGWDDVYIRNNPGIVRTACERILLPPKRGIPPEKLLLVRLHLLQAIQCLGDFDAMQSHAEVALKEATTLGNISMTNEARRRLAFAKQKLGNFSEAVQMATLSLQSSRDNHLRLDEADSLNLLGIIQWKLGDLSTALQNYNGAILIYDALGEKRRAYSTLVNCGIIHWNLKNYALALEYYERCLTRDAEAVLDNVTLAAIHSNIAEVHRELGELDKARTHLSQSLALEEQTGNKEGIAFTLNNLGEVEMAAGDLPVAQRYQERAVILHRETGSVYGEVHSLYYLGILAHKNGQLDQSRNFLETTVALAEREHIMDFYCRAHGELNKVYAALGRFEDAWKSHQAFKTASDSLSNEQSSKAIAEIEARLELNQKRAQVALLTQETELRELAYKETLSSETYKQRALWGALLAAIAGTILLWIIYRVRLRGHRALEASNRRIEEANHKLEQRVEERTASLRESQARYRSLVRHFPNGIVALLDRKGATLLAGGGAIERLGISSDAVTGKIWSDWLPPALTAMAQPHWARALDGQPATIECDLEHEAWWVFFVPTQGESETVGKDSITLLLVELTELRKVQNELEVKQGQLAHSARLATLGEFSARIAHELNQPMQVMVFACSQLAHELTLESPDTALIREQADAIQTQIDRASEIINSMRTYSRGEVSRQKHQPINTCVVASEAIPFFRTELRNKQIHLDLNLDPATPAICMPHAHFQQILVNLISNAIHALHLRTENASSLQPDSPAFRPVLTVHLAPTPDGSGALLVVSDNGAGMDETTRRRCLEPFFTTKSASDGTGLGLSIIHGFISRQSGQVEISSTPGNGSTFRITLPIHPQHPHGA
ncbi:MAG: tetratricopeptide repeat-containing sensor histidine kinase [Verrucomicrobiota bacterium]|nr:tetratricopeptide repeat-containing sensor histidine kinase [Verrucomicrobiota bacterium]